MKISRRLVIKIALQVLDERGVATQYDIHTAIAEHLKRQLTTGEKIRITRILSSEFYVSETRREGQDKVRIYVFKI